MLDRRLGKASGKRVPAARAEVHRRLENRLTTGKLVLRPCDKV
ncbi:hypothetical protein [Methylovirgula sp. 4M-Z18]|nr:hypothetical protein [Methylovirgula sp. 4M-Z18]